MDLAKSKKDLKHFLSTVVFCDVEWPEVEKALHIWIDGRDPYTDIIPMLACYVAGGDPSDALPLAAFWSLYVLSARLSDDILDGETNRWAELLGDDVDVLLPAILSLISSANHCLAHLDVDAETLRQIMSTMGRSWALAAKSQRFTPHYDLTLERYLENIVSSTGTLFAAIMWTGGRIATQNTDTLNLLSEYGFNVGMCATIISDCQDLQEQTDKKSDLDLGLYKLPVIHAASLSGHPKHGRIMQILSNPQHLAQNMDELRQLVKEMGAIDWSLSLSEQYRQEALSVLDRLNGDCHERAIILRNYI